MSDAETDRQHLEAAAEALELQKVLELVTRYATGPAAVQEIVSLPILSDARQIEKELGRVSSSRRLLDSGEDLPIDYYDDLTSIFNNLKVQGRRLTPEALVALARLAKIARQVRTFLKERQELYPPLWDIAQQIILLREFEQAVRRAIDFSSFEILDSASPALRRIRREIESTQQAVRAKLQKILQKAAAKDMLQEQLITVRDGRLVLMVKDEFKRSIRGIVHDQSATGQTLFVEPVETVEMSNRIRQLEAEERAEIERILEELSALAGEHLEALRQDYYQVLVLDVIRAKAKYSQVCGSSAAQVNTGGAIILYAARHPLLLEKYQDPKKVVPLQLKLGKTFNTLIITGPNAGGKTVAMKTVGLAVLMTRAGLHIPASPDSEIGLMGRVFADIGDRQSIEDDLSTFTSHMIRLRDMLEHARANDLVLIDEMGSGTDPEEGTALALAALRDLNERGVRAIVTTHHGALKVFAHNTPGVENGSMIFDVKTLQPTYEFRLGVPGASYAFDIGSRIGLDPQVIAAARSLVGADRGKLEMLISDLQEKIQQQEEVIRKLEQEEMRLQELIKLYEERSERLAANERKLKKQAIQESEAILARANAAVEEAIREIREQHAAKETIRASRERLQQEKTALKKELQKIRPPRKKTAPRGAALDASQIAPGMEVLWRPQQARATVIDAPDAEKRVYVQVGSLKLRVPLQELESVQEVRKSRTANVMVERSVPVSQELDVRGMRADEALAAVDQYLSEALLYGWEEVRIIHGKGTGALRKAITEHLQHHPNVASFGAAPLGRGDIGVTEVKLK